MADAVPSAPVKASVLRLKLQRYAGPGPGSVAEVAALALAPAGGSRVRIGAPTASEVTRTSRDQVTGRVVPLRHPVPAHRVRQHAGPGTRLGPRLRCRFGRATDRWASARAAGGVVYSATAPAF